MPQVPKFFTTPQEKKEYYPSKIWKVLLICLTIFVALIIIFFFSPLFKIKNVEVVSPVNLDQVNSFFDTFKGKNIFLVDTSKTKSNVQIKFPEVLDLQISKGIPNMLRVKVNQYEPKIVWVSSGEKYLADENGVIFQKGSADNLPQVLDSKNLPVEILKPVAINNFVEFVSEISEKMSTGDLVVDHYEVNETTFQVTAVTKNNLKIIFDTTRPAQDQIVAAQKVYTEHKEEVKQYLDVRVEGKVYYQ